MFCVLIILFMRTKEEGIKHKLWLKPTKSRQEPTLAGFTKLRELPLGLTQFRLGRQSRTMATPMVVQHALLSRPCHVLRSQMFTPEARARELEIKCLRRMQ